MTDSVLVFPAGFRVVDSDGAPMSGAQVRFFEAGTTTPKEVFSDSALSESIGSIVYTRSDGYLVAEEGSSTTVLVYIDAGLYKVDILDSDDVTLYPSKDDVQGAVDTSDFLTSSDTSSVVIPTVALAADTSISTTYTGKLINASSNPTLTLAAPATLGDGWNARIRCADTGYVKIVAASGAIKGSGFSIAAIAIAGLGETVELACDGANVYVCGRVPGRVAHNGRIFAITDRVTSAPATTPNNFYIVQTGFGAFSTGDIIEATGQATFIGYTPPTDCGWLAYVADENAYYSFQDSAWVCLSATQTQMEALAATGVFASPANMQYHPGVAKAWGKITNAGSAVIAASYNVASAVRNSSGLVTITFTTAMSSATYAVLVTIHSTGALKVHFGRVVAQATGTVQIETDIENSTSGNAASATDIDFSFVVFGDL